MNISCNNITINKQSNEHSLDFNLPKDSYKVNTNDNNNQSLDVHTPLSTS
jgi:hypothetical protein